jgi:hypothetical protein
MTTDYIDRLELADATTDARNPSSKPGPKTAAQTFCRQLRRR